MRKVLLICFLVLAAIGAQAQGFLRERFLLEGDYTRSGGFKPSCVLAFDVRMPNEHGLTFGYKIGPTSDMNFNFAYQIALVEDWANKGLFYIENRYLYRRFKAYGMQEFNAMFSLGYRNIHWKFKLGLCNRYIAAIPLRLDGGMGTIFEPMNVVFDVQYHLFDEYHRWNVGAGISNQREFIIERVTLFYYTLNGYYNINDKWRVLGEAGLHPAGVLNLSSQYNGYFINLGFTYNP